MRARRTRDAAKDARNGPFGTRRSESRLRLSDLEHIEVAGATGVFNPFVTQGEQLFFGEVPTSDGNDAVVGHRGSGERVPG
jgi:hypothetical protein